MIPLTAYQEAFTHITGEDACTEQQRLAIAGALATPLTPRARPGEELRCRLGLLAGTLPSAAQLLRDIPQMSLLSSYTAVADPSLYMAVLSHYILCLGSVLTLAGSLSELAGPVEELQTGRRKGVFMVTEVGQAGSHLGVRTTADFDLATRRFVLRTPDADAAKFSAVGARHTPQTAVVCARVRVAGADCGVFSFLVDLSEETGPVPGVRISSRVDVSSLPLDYALVHFDQLAVPYERWLRDTAWIDPSGAFHDPLNDQDSRLQRTLSVGQSLWSSLPSAMAATARAAAVAATRACSTRLSNGRLAPGRPLLTYRTQQQDVLGALSEAFALTAGARAARGLSTEPTDATRLSPGIPGMTFSPWAAVAPSLALYKALTVRGARRVATVCTHRLGLPGLMDVNAFHAYLGLAQAFESAGGDNQLIFLDTGQRLIAEPERPLGETMRPQRAQFDDPWWWPPIVETLQRLLCEELRRDMNRRANAGLCGLDLWNPLLHRTRMLGEVHAQNLLARDVAETLDCVADPCLRTVLCDLAALHAVQQAQQLAGTLVETRLLSIAAVRGLPSIADDLCDRILPHLHQLTQAMGPPPELASPPLSHDNFADSLASRLTWYHGGAA
ncbi:acyl-CoA dehydrogenase [Streptomyces sp. NPDC023327]|uniref:acyl-CoA dehydrogenase n=1 Tax=Streptomyces sp. NPDC023327 TaxID=3157088 RepID=UPI0033F4DBE9